MASDLDEVEEKHYYIWNDCENALNFLGGDEKEKKIPKRHKRKLSVMSQSKVYCLHVDLILEFLDVLNLNQKMKFRKHYLRKVSPNTPDVITIQDIKNLVMYLLITPISLEFINFFHLRIVDRFLRALIIYFQSYTEIWEEKMRKRSTILTKVPNPLTQEDELIQADQMRELRCILAEEYCGLLLGCDGCVKYHHIMANAQAMSLMSRSEKDLRIFDPLISIAHRVVWIALQRKYFHLIEIELHRLLRTDAYNIASRRSERMSKMLLKEEERILHGPKMPLRRKLLQNSPLVHQLLAESCDFRVVSLGIINFDSKDPRINYLKNSLLIEEEKLLELKIKVGILGHSRKNFDITLVPIENEKIVKRESAGVWEREDISLPEKLKGRKSIHEKVINIPVYGDDPEILEVFPWGKVKIQWNMYDDNREEARKKWILRELDRQTQIYTNAISVLTTGDY